MSHPINDIYLEQSYDSFQEAKDKGDLEGMEKIINSLKEDGFDSEAAELWGQFKEYRGNISIVAA